MQRRDALRLMSQWLGASALGGCVFKDAPECAPGKTLDAAAFTRLRRYVPTSFGEVAYVAHGHGPVALFLHGFPLNGFQWRDVMALLAPFRRCIAPDFLGLGWSRPAPGQDLGPRSQVLMLAALLDALQIPQVDLIANDSGGAVAQLFAIRHPARVRTLVLTNCDTEIECPPAAMLPVIGLARAGRFADEWLLPWLADPELARSDAGIGGLCYADRRHPTDEALRMYFEPLLDSPERKAALHRYAVALEPNALAGISAALRNSRVAVRIAWGMADTIFKSANADYLQEAFGNSRGVRRLDGFKLFWPEERPDVVAGQARILWESARG